MKPLFKPVSAYSVQRLALLALAGLSVSACQPMGANEGINGGPALAAPDTVTLRLAEAAEKAANSLDNISRIEQVRTPMAQPANADDDIAGAPPELAEPVTITWTGPLERYMQAMASRAGYSFRTIGSPPPVPLTVAIDVHQQPLLNAIKSAALQVSGRADVVLDASRQSIEVRYAPTDGAGDMMPRY